MDSWTATSITNAPNGRYEHTAIWTGSEMIVWGGFIGGFPLNNGGRYNPGTDSWTATSTANAPSGEASTTAVWTGSEMIVWGGWDDQVCFEYWREIQSGHGQLDSHQHHRCARLSIQAHGGLDRPRNDRLGRKGRPRTISTPAANTIRARTAGQPPAPPTRRTAEPSHGSLDRQ